MNQPDRNIRPEIHDIGPLILEEANTEILPNGITLHIVEGGDSNLCRLGILLPGGIMEQPAPGIFRAAASLLPEGSAENPGKMMSENLERKGAWTGTSVTTHHTLINIYCLDYVFNDILPLARQMAFTPGFDPDLSARTLRQISSQTQLDRHKVMANASHALKQRLYGTDSPMAAWIDPEEILKVTPEILRGAHGSRLDLSKTHLYLAGSVKTEMASALKAEFGTISSDVSFDFNPVTMSGEKGGEIFTDVDGAVQNAIIASIPCPGRLDPDFYNIRFATMALGGYFGSRLMKNIREDKGLTYGIDAQLYAHPEKSFMQISSQTDCRNTESLIAEILIEIERMKDPATFTPDEMERLTKFVLSSLSAVLDTPFQRMDYLQTREISQTPVDYFARQEQAIRQITPDILASTARKYLHPSGLTISVAGRRE